MWALGVMVFGRSTTSHSTWKLRSQSQTPQQVSRDIVSTSVCVEVRHVTGPLVITAITVEERSKCEVAPGLWGVSGLGVKAGAPFPGRGGDGVHTAIAKTAWQSAGGRC